MTDPKLAALLDALIAAAFHDGFLSRSASSLPGERDHAYKRVTEKRHAIEKAWKEHGKSQYQRGFEQGLEHETRQGARNSEWRATPMTPSSSERLRDLAAWMNAEIDDCGTTPDHLREIAAELDHLKAQSEFSLTSWRNEVNSLSNQLKQQEAELERLRAALDMVGRRAQDREESALEESK